MEKRTPTSARGRIARAVGWLLLSVLPATPSGAAGQATALVPLDDRSYEILDRLTAQLPLQELVHGQRPYTRRAFARLTVQAREALGRVSAGSSPLPPARRAHLESLLAALEGRYAAELRRLDGDDPRSPPAALDLLRLEATSADSPFRGFVNNGLGNVDSALVNPLLDERWGRELSDGGTLALEAELRAGLGPYLAAFASPRLSYHLPRSPWARAVSLPSSEESVRVSGGGEEDADVLLRHGALRGKLGGWALQVGRAPLRRGQGRRAAVLFSDNAPPLDMVYLESEDPFRLPWILRALGPTRFSAFLADLGADQNFPRAQLYGNWLTFRPARRLELGGGFVVHSGGEGSPEQTFWERVGDYLIFVDIFFKPTSDFTASNKIAGVDFRLSLPEAGLVVYGEFYMDDFRVQRWSSVGEILWPDAGHVLGISFPRLDGTGRMSGWAEYQHTGLRLYRHSPFTSGVVQRRWFLGNALGPHANAVKGGLDFLPSVSSTVSLEVGWDSRSHDWWSAPEEPVFHFQKLGDAPEEERVRARLSWERRPLEGGLGWRAELGGERVTNLGFEEGEGATNAVLQVVIAWAPRR